MICMLFYAYSGFRIGSTVWENSKINIIHNIYPNGCGGGGRQKVRIQMGRGGGGCVWPTDLFIKFQLVARRKLIEFYAKQSFALVFLFSLFLFVRGNFNKKRIDSLNMKKILQPSSSRCWSSGIV